MVMLATHALLRACSNTFVVEIGAEKLCSLNHLGVTEVIWSMIPHIKKIFLDYIHKCIYYECSAALTLYIVISESSKLKNAKRFWKRKDV